MLFLKQSTASQSVLLGPYVDDSDGVTAETGLTVNNTDIRLSKNGGNMAAKNSGGGTHDENGWYQITLDATDTDTVGRLQVSSKVSGALPVFAEFQVLEEAIYDAIVGASAAGFDSNQRVDVGSWLGTAVTLGNGAPDVNIASTDDIDLSATQKASVNAEADSAIETYGLDHLISASVAGTDVADDSIIAQMVSASATADWDDFVNTTDSLQAIRDRGDSAWITATTVDLNADQSGVTVGTVNALGTQAKADVNAEVDSALDTAIPGVPTANSINERIAAIDDLTQASGNGDLAAILTDTGTTIPGLIGTPSVDLAADIAALNDLSAAEVNSEVEDVLKTDSLGEPTGVPGASTNLAEKIGYLYMALRNKVSVTATKKQFYDDDGNAEWEKDLSDSGTEYAESEANAI